MRRLIPPSCSAHVSHISRSATTNTRLLDRNATHSCLIQIICHSMSKREIQRWPGRSRLAGVLTHNSADRVHRSSQKRRTRSLFPIPRKLADPRLSNIFYSSAWMRASNRLNVVQPVQQRGSLPLGPLRDGRAGRPLPTTSCDDGVLIRNWPRQVPLFERMMLKQACERRP